MTTAKPRCAHGTGFHKFDTYKAPKIRVGSPQMATRKGLLWDNVGRVPDASDPEGTIFEAREVAIVKPPIRILSRIEEVGLLSRIAELGLLSLAAEKGVFTFLEEKKALGLVEKLLPFIEKIGLLSFFEFTIDDDPVLIDETSNYAIGAVFAYWFNVKQLNVWPEPEWPITIPFQIVWIAFFVFFKSWGRVVRALQEVDG